ncbi:MAG TPA: FAD-dependent oxidoreductase, partial [Polyangiaceae bacterium]|nr:FAD-dependent oxidoreductase [Polyangiaceae bacterium]
TAWDRERSESLITSTLSSHGVKIEWAASPVLATPADFARRFPGSRGAIYGAATHGMGATFARPGARTSIPGLYLAGGSVHPGAGVPMAATSGRLSALALLEDLPSIARSRRTAMPGGISTL